MERLKRSFWLGLALLAVSVGIAQGQKGEILTEHEQDQLREAQDPSERIELYLALAQARLDSFDEARKKPLDPQYDSGAYLDDLLGQHIALNDELKNWINFQSERNGDMRGGLQQSPDAYASTYANTLRDAIDDLSDTLDGATRALADQEKKFTELKRAANEVARLSKERAKEEKKRTKEEKKLHKRQRPRSVPADSDDY